MVSLFLRFDWDVARRTCSPEAALFGLALAGVGLVLGGIVDPSFRSPRRTPVLPPVVAVPAAAPAAPAAPAVAEPSDVDRLLLRLGQGGCVTNARARHSVWAWSGLVEPGEVEMGWIRAVEKLEASPTREVADAAKRLKPVGEILSGVVADEKQTRAINAELRAKAGPDFGEVMAALGRMDDVELDERVRDKSMTLEQAGEYRSQTGAIKNNVLQKFGAGFAATLPNYLAMKRRTEQQRQRAEVLRSNVVAEVLRPALRARAGGQRSPPPIDVKVAMIPREDLMRQAYVSVHSRAAEELTQLTVLLELQTTAGWRYATIYVPRLPPSGWGRFEPIPLSTAFLNDVPKEAGNPSVNKFDVTRVRYSIWCNQFRAEEQDATLITADELIDDYRLQAVRPGVVIVSRGGMAMNPVPGGAKAPPPPRGRGAAQPVVPNVKAEVEPDRRFEIVFKELVANKQGYEVALDWVDHRAAGAGAQRARGTFQLPPVKHQSYMLVAPEELVLKLSVGGQEMRLRQLGQWNSYDVDWQWASEGTGIAPAGRRFVPTAELPAPGSPDVSAGERLRAAMKLATEERKYDQARQAYEQIIADFPDSGPAKMARQLIDGLENLKADHRRLDEARKTQGRR